MNFVEEAWLMLLELHSELVTREVIGHSKAEGLGDVQISSIWNRLEQEFHDIFNPPGMPVDRDTMHHCQVCSSYRANFWLSDGFYFVSIGYILKKLWYVKVIGIKSKILVRWPKYVAILYNFNKYSRKIV